MHSVDELRGRRLPTSGSPAGYAFVVEKLNLPVPPPFELHAVADRTIKMKADGWVVHPRGRWPGDGIIDHLLFAIKNEPVDLRILKATLAKIDPSSLIAELHEKPGGQFIRRLCFFYEWLLNDSLPDAPVTGQKVDALDTRLQYGLIGSFGANPALERRYRVIITFREKRTSVRSSRGHRNSTDS